MASIVKRNGKFNVVYYATDKKGQRKQRWEKFDTQAEAKQRKAELEYELSSNSFFVPTVKTMAEFLEEYVNVYGKNKWSLSTYESKKSIITHYIVPSLGAVKLSDITPRMMNSYYQNLLTYKATPKPFQKKVGLITPRTVQEIHKLLRNAFNIAVKWELLPRNPVEHCVLPKCADHQREIWDTETLITALEVCEDPLLALGMNLAFSCSLRMGELLGLTWDCVEISEDKINADKAFIFINKELQRVSRKTIEELDGADIIMKFPATHSTNTTILVLKPPKTATSVRKIFLPRTVALMLLERKKEIDTAKDLLGSEYIDYNLVMCSNEGKPIEGSRLNTALDKLIEEHHLPRVVFHSLRHTSTTYKLKLSGGDIKAVQGDTGHAQATMVTERYAHIMDDDRRQNARRLEQAFYGRQGDSADGSHGESETERLVRLLDQSPELMAVLKAMAAKI